MKSPKRLTSMRAFFAVAACLLFAAVAAEAQGRGGGSGSGQHSGQGKGTATQPRGSGAGAGQHGVGRGAQDRDRIHVNDQQRDQFKDCTGAADQVRRQARDMSKSASGAGFDVAAMRQQRDRIHEHVSSMSRLHDRMMAGFGNGEQSRLQDRTAKLDRARDRMQTCLSNLDQALGRQQVNGKAVAREARELEKASRQWQKEYRKLGQELGLS